MHFDGDSQEKKDELRQLFKKLGEVINDTLAHSKEVQEILGRVSVFGLGVDLSMVIGLGIYSRSDAGRDIDLDSDTIPDGEIRFELTTGDRAFLDHNKLKLTLDSDTQDAAGN